MHWDGKLGRTLRELVFAPGAMAAAYASGRRQPYLNPLRLYLVLFVAQVFLAGIGTPVLRLAERVQRLDSTGLVMRWQGEKILAEAGNPTPGAHTDTYQHWLSEIFNLLIVFVVAGALMLVLYKYRRRYLEHLTLSLNVISFTLLVLIAGDITTLILGRGTISDLAFSYRLNAAAFLLPIYWFFSIRRFYGTSWGGAACFAVVITAADVVVANVLNVLSFLIEIALV
jgi:Protein of unknown function (DUF3667)